MHKTLLPFILLAVTAASNKIKKIIMTKVEFVSSLVILIVVRDCSEKLND